MEKLAYLGGKKTINKELKPYISFGKEEIESVQSVLQSGELSRFYGSWHEDFFGGKKVKEFESNWSKEFGIEYSVSVNSATSGLIAALGAVGVEPFDEVLVSPWTMCASATAILVWNAIPVFVDINPDNFNIDPSKIRSLITKKTKAIVVPDIFGQSAQLTEILKIAKEFGLKVIEDASQAPGAMYRGKKVGTNADIGVFSLNYHKHIHTGEGGVCVTADAKLAERLQLIRNHAEAVVGPKGEIDISNMIGFNFRLGEIESAIGIEQLKKLPSIAEQRIRAGALLNEGLKDLKGLKLPVPLDGCTHVYYMYGLIVDFDSLGITREKLIEVLTAEGIPSLRPSYLNIHLLPMYQKRIAYGKSGFPWISPGETSKVTYEKGICPIAENLQDKSYIGFYFGGFALDDEEINLLIAAFRKVWNQLDLIK
ncbi:DegT/DnrJ/EryC1/StrS family aminotransferase [Leptospira meyeri]|uniref:DegT/DnrJ/EryC1/StrS family aminotransferase n=1 Tax=Leptospira meyeri TaxID=29508 RepID=UPI0010841572|nr:DegT/DnrJ/EryC1/StrS family aminotransferase [Leptospira meyeri]TGL52964.1 DegT/DnrJ/EryC1/StrS family aminotransferase [Leptospira meyeri]